MKKRFQEGVGDNVGIARAPGTVGELVQGYVDDVDCMVTAPMDRYATSTVTLTSQPGVVVESNRNLSKAKLAVEKTFTHFHVADFGALLKIDSNIEAGKGMASSTADIAAAIAAAAKALGRKITPREVAKFALEVEPSDGVFFDGVVLWDHVQGRELKFLGSPPLLGILVVDSGGSVRTVEEFDRAKARAVGKQHEDDIRRAIHLVKTGIRYGNSRLIGVGATLSSRINQEVLFKPMLENLIGTAMDAGALGVNVAHSGTVMGVLFDIQSADVDKLRARIYQTLGDVPLDLRFLRGGGFHIAGNGN